MKEYREVAEEIYKDKENLLAIIQAIVACSFGHLGYDLNDLSFRYWEPEELGPGHPGGLQAYVNCNDVFYWGSADCEEITKENIHLLIQSVKDCYEIGGYWCASEFSDTLFACRSRGMRPQGAAYPKKECWDALRLPEDGYNKLIELI